MNFDATTVWFLIGLGLILLEFAAPGVVVVFIGLGAWVTAAACALGVAESVGAQMAWFGGSSLLGLVLLRRLFKGWFLGFSSERDTSVDLDDFSGQQVTVTEVVLEGGRGAAEYKGARWAARAVANETFEVQERAVIQQVDGLCLVLRKKTN